MGRDTLSNRKYPHWFGKKSGIIYKSTKALGVIWDYVEEKIRSVQQHNKENFSDKSEVNSFIMNHIRKIEIKAESDKAAEDYLNKLRSKMRNAAVQYNSEFSKCLGENSFIRDEFDKDTWNWMKSRHEFWRKKLFKSIDYDNINLAAAVLYEQVSILSLKKSIHGDEKAYKFAWYIAQDILTRIIGDGKAMERGLGLPPCFDRDIEKNLKFKK